MTEGLALGKSCTTCGDLLFLGLCERCARRAANDPDFAATDEAQAALAQAAELYRIARRRAAADWSEAEKREAWGR